VANLIYHQKKCLEEKKGFGNKPTSSRNLINQIRGQNLKKEKKILTKCSYKEREDLTEKVLAVFEFDV
jgi:hypothetical protein